MLGNDLVPQRCTAQIRIFRVCAVLVFAPACTGAPAEETGTAIEATLPSLTAATVGCDVAAAEWRFTATTDAWTGNGQVLLSTDGAYVEKHTLYSQSAAADGSADSLALTLDIESDWRDVVIGSSTAFNCNEADLTGILRVWSRDGTEQADCRAFGVSPERWDTWDAGARCATLLDAPAD